MQFPLIDKLARSNGSKILWVVSDSFSKDSEDGSRQSALELAWTPNFDGLCGESETGILRRGLPAERPVVNFDSIARMSILEIDGSGLRPVLDEAMGGVRCESAMDFPGIERLLAAQWDHYDLFMLNLGWRSFAGELGEDLNRREWIEMLDAWLPGLLSVFEPEVFAMSGDIWTKNVASNSYEEAGPVLLHSRKSRALQTEGFTLDCCRKGRLGTELSLRHWLLLLLAHSERLDEVMMEIDGAG